MSSPQNLLQLLQTRTIVDCDTMDVEGMITSFLSFNYNVKERTNYQSVAKKLGPFVDCTSNQVL